jgi:hypothetical protein
VPQLNFDATQVAPQEAFELIPAGWYVAAIDESEMRPTRDGSSEYLQIRLSVLEGDHVNRKLFDRFNIANANPVAREIAYKELSAVAHACAVLHVADSNQLHGIPMRVKVRIRRDPNGEYEDQNEVTGYRSVNDNVGGATAGAAAPAWATGKPTTAAKAPTAAARKPATAQAPAAESAAAPDAAGDKPPWLR